MLSKVLLVVLIVSYCYPSIDAKELDIDSCPVNDCTLVPQLCLLKRNVSELNNRTKNIENTVGELFVRGRKIDEDVNNIRNNERSLKIRLAKLEKENLTLKQELRLLKEIKILNLEKENSNLRIQIQSMKEKQETTEAALRKLTDVTLAILRNQTLFNKAENTQQQNEIENIRSQLENVKDVKTNGT